MIKTFIVITALICAFSAASADMRKSTKHKRNENVPFELMNNMQNWMIFKRPGESVDFAGGKLHRIAEGARFVDAMGVTVVIPQKKPDYNYIANKSPVLARFWAEKYGFKPNPPDYEYDGETQVDDNLSFFDSLLRALKIVKEKEADIRAKIAGHPGVRKNFSCTNIEIEVEENSLEEIKKWCEELNKSGIDHHNLFVKLQKAKADLDARGKNDLVIPSEVIKFEKDFSPFIFK